MLVDAHRECARSIANTTGKAMDSDNNTTDGDTPVPLTSTAQQPLQNGFQSVGIQILTVASPFTWLNMHRITLIPPHLQLHIVTPVQNRNQPKIRNETRSRRTVKQKKTQN